jgi:hypothetical protein
MAKKKQRNSEGKQNPGNIKAGHYTPSMVSFLGYELIKSAYDQSILVVEDQLRFSNEVRTKGLHTAGLLTTLSVGLIAAICSVESTMARVVMSLLTVVLLGGLHGIFWGVIYRKNNVTRGTTQSYSLDGGMIDALKDVDASQRAAFYLASSLKGIERDAVRQREQVDKMQTYYQRITKTVIVLISVIMLVTMVITLLFATATPAL